jgi:nucleotide-binding universal stress UspA family protein
MFHKILAALGHASSRQHVFEKALEASIQYKAKLLLVHVLDCEDVLPIKPAANHNFFVGQSAYESYWQSHENARRKAVEWLDVFVQEAKDAGVDAQYVVHNMSPERVLPMQAKAWGADLIVMGDHGSSTMSISDYMYHHTACTILVLPIGDFEEVAPKCLFQSATY